MEQLAHYQLEALIGEGAFARVYRAYDPDQERHVALKVLRPFWLEDAQALERFKREARVMARLAHPNILPVYEIGEAQGQVFLVQRLVKGVSLAGLLKRKPLSWKGALSILRPLASALDYAHDRRIIHRDLKPANILLDPGGQIYLSDFGLVRAAEGSAVLSAGSGGLIGTPAYMAPEQWEGQAVTPAADVYALSCLAAEMVTGQLLFQGSTPANIMKKHLVGEPALPESWPPGVPAGLAETLRRGLALSPEARIQRAGDLVRALSRLSVEAAPDTRPLPPAPVELAPEPAPAPAAPPPAVVGEAPAEAPGPEPPAGPPEKASRQKRWIGMAVVLAAGLMFLLGAAILNVTLPTAPTPTPTVTLRPPLVDPTVLTEESDYEFAVSYNNRGISYYDHGKYDLAIEHFNLSLQFKPDFAEAYYNRALAYFARSNYDSALKDYTIALELNPDYAAAYYGRALTHQVKGHTDQAVADYERFLALNDDPDLARQVQAELDLLK